MTIRMLKDEEWAQAVTLAADAGLPVADLAVGRQTLWGAFEGGAVAGVVGTQAFGTVTLLRTLVVAPEFRGRGVASALTDYLWASHRGAHWVLLTETAEDFFRRRGFLPVDRESVPAAVRASAEFQGLCPVSAVCLVRLDKA